MKKYPTHMIIPDTQVKPGVRIDHFVWAARLALEVRPDYIIHLGDHWDMASLSKYETKAKKAVNKMKVKKDIEAGNKAMDLFFEVINNHNKRARGNSRYYPELEFFLGNHENRIVRAHEEDPILEGSFSQDDFNLIEHGWKVNPFLKPKKIDSILYCHYFCRGASGAVTQDKRGQPSASAQIKREGCSATAGHRQGLDTHSQVYANGIRRGIIAGSFYLHQEAYLTEQYTKYWRGILIKKHIRRGNYDLIEYSMSRLKEEYS